MKKISLNFLFALVVINGFAQQDSASKASYRIQPHDIQAAIGSFVWGDFRLPVAGFLLANPETKEIYQTYYNGRNAVIPYNSGLNLQLMAGFRFKNKLTGEFNNRISLRLGLHFQHFNWGLLSELNSSTTKLPDQVIDANTVIKRDSNYFDLASTSIQVQALHAHSALLFYTHPENQLQLYTGIGASLGFFYQNVLRSFRWFSHYERETKYINNQPQGFSTISNYSPGSTTQYDVPLGYRFWSFINVPLGLRMRLGVNNNITNRIYLGLELQPGIQLSASKAQTFRAGFASLSMLTLNYAFRK